MLFADLTARVGLGSANCHFGSAKAPRATRNYAR